MQDMSIISLIFTAALALVCLYLILHPFLKFGAPSFSSQMGSQDVSSMKEALLTTLNELEFEYKMDKISASDYKHLKRQYEVEIANIMKEEEQGAEISIDNDLMAEVEKEIAEQMKTYKNKRGKESD